MSVDDDPLPLEAFTPRGMVRPTSAAIGLATQFQASIPSGFVTAFIWCEGREMRTGKDGPWVDMGAGLDIGAYSKRQIPEGAVEQAGTLRYTVLIPSAVVTQSSQKIIDLDGDGHVVLR